MKIYHGVLPQVSGWYNADFRLTSTHQKECWRFFHVDSGWSTVFYEHNNVPSKIDSCIGFTSSMHWAMYWPENARVPDTRVLDDSKFNPENITPV